MKISELRNKTEIELKELLTSNKKGLETYVSDLLKEKEKNKRKAVYMKRDLARIKTVLAEKEFLTKEAK